MATKRVVLIHAVPVSIPPIRDAFTEGWPEAEISNLLDDGLTGALSREGGLTPRIVQRICDLATYAARTGADGILFTCSAFTPAMDLAKQRVTIPLLKPDEAMIAAALETGRRIGIVATMPAAAPTQAEQLEAAAAEQGKTIRVETAVAADALAALNAGDTAGHDRLVAEAVARLAETVDAICLAQFSMARARAAAQARVPVPVLTSPAAAVARLKAMLTVKRET
jgi:Asp/Glu/hydantoin racemase